MKTEKKVIECWANYYPEITKLPILYTYEDAAEEHCKEGITVPCTITLHLPVQEKTVTITESEFEAAWEHMQKRGNGIESDLQAIKSKLFGVK